MKPLLRADDRRRKAADRLFWALIAGFLVLWACLDGGLR